MSALASALSGIGAVVIDLDGTMIDTAPDFHVAVNRMRADLDLPAVTQEVIISRVGKGTENLVRSILALDLAPAQVEPAFPAALARYHHHYQSINGQYSAVYPGVLDGLTSMREQGLRLACVTNKPIGFARPLLAATGLLHFFELVYGGDSLARKKPDPLPMLQVAREFGIAPGAMLAIGDSSNDAQAARAAGCPILVVPYGYNHGLPVQTIDADGIVQTLAEAATLLAASASRQATRTTAAGQQPR